MPSFQINNHAVNITASTIGVIFNSKTYEASLSSFKFRDSYYFPNVSHDLKGTIMFLLEQHLDKRPDIDVFFSDVSYQYKFMEMTIRIETDHNVYERLTFNLPLKTQVSQPTQSQSFVVDKCTINITPQNITVTDNDDIFEAPLNSFKIKNSHEFPYAETDLYGTLVRNIRELTSGISNSHRDSSVNVYKDLYQCKEIKLSIAILVGFQDYNFLDLKIPYKASKKTKLTQFQISGYTVNITPQKIIATNGCNRYEAMLSSFKFRNSHEFPTASSNLYDTLIHNLNIHMNNTNKFLNIYVTSDPYQYKEICMTVALQVGYQEYNSLLLKISKV